jgi:vancomycin resistance protein YoaR
MNKNINGEKIFTIFALAIIISVIVFVIYSVFSSNKYFYNNVSENTQENNINLPKTQEENVTTNDENMNVSDNKKTELNKTNEQPTTQEPSTPIETEIASYTTSIYDKDENRVFNISKAIQTLNNTLIPANSEFSFNKTIGPMNLDAGYKKALGFDTKGNKIQIAGGGMCQISSTLYNAALIANLEITERHPHSRRVYYVPKDKDATIFYDSLDLKFKNNTSSNIKIIATNDNTNVTIKLVKIS